MSSGTYEQRTVRPRSGSHPRRCQFAGAGLRVGGRDAVFRCPSERSLCLRRRGKPLHRLRAKLRPDDSWSRPPGCNRSGANRRGFGHKLRCADAGRGSPSRRDHSRRVVGLEMVRLVSSGTEATMTAIRMARGATGRDRIVKFAGNYHGH